jgi:glycosyltransferase involved in cell wall biosynthesis
MRVFVNYFYFSQYFKVRNTDIIAPRNFKYLEEYDSSVNVVFNRGLLSHLLFAIGFLGQRLFRRTRLVDIFRPLFENVYLLPWQVSKVDVIYSHGISVRTLFSKRKPVVLDSGFMTNDYVGLSGDPERLEEIRKIEKACASADIVLFSSYDALDRVGKLSQVIKRQARFAPTYLLDGVVAADDGEIRDKYHDSCEVRLSFVGRQGIRKGLMELYSALDKIKSGNPIEFKKLDVSIVSREPQLRNQFESLGDNIHFHEEVSYSEVKRIIRNSHIFCLPTKKEALGLVFLEAMAYGCVVIADNKQPRVEIFDEGGCGYLVDPTNVTAIAAAIIEVVDNMNTGLEIALRAKSKFLDLYSREVTADRYIQYFKEAIHLHR